MKRHYQRKPHREALKRSWGVRWSVGIAIDESPPPNCDVSKLASLDKVGYIRMCRNNAKRWRAEGIPFLMWAPVDADIVPSSMWALNLYDKWTLLIYVKGAYWIGEEGVCIAQASLDEYYSFASSVPLSRWPGDPPIETKPTPQLEPHFTKGETSMGHYHFSNPTPATPPAPPALVPLPPSFTDLLMDKELRKRQPRFDPVPGNGIVYMTHAGTIYEVRKFVPGQSLQAIWQGYLQVAEPPPVPRVVTRTLYFNVWEDLDGCVVLGGRGESTRNLCESIHQPEPGTRRVGIHRVDITALEGQFDD